jgi:hypothetical protein
VTACRRCCWMLSFSLSQRAATLTSLARCRAASAAALGGDGACDSLAADDVDQTRRVFQLLGE